MRSSQRTALALTAMTLVVSSAIGVIWRIQTSKHPVDTATIYAGDLAAVAIGVTLLLSLGAWWWKGVRGTAPHGGTQAQVAAAADKLAESMAAFWRDEAARRRIVTPAPVTVHWRWAENDLAAPRSEVAVPPTPGSGPQPLPGLEEPGEPLESGVVTRLHDELYARLPYGRLVVLGGPGAGKTGAMILLLLAALSSRESLTSDQRYRMPVPIWLTLGSWNAVTTTLNEWVKSTINRDHPALRASAYGPDAAGQLLVSGQVALFLDGLDEVPESMRAQAIKRIDMEARGLRIVMTSRPEEYRDAVQAGGPDNTAIIEVRPVSSVAAAAYLLRDQTGTNRQRWEKIGTYLKQHPDSVITQALNNPLNLSMARDAYVSKDPTELIKSIEYSSVAVIREHLIDQILITAYPGDLQREHATRWLAWIAHHMGSSRDLPWWDVPTWIASWQLRLTAVLITGLGVGFIDGLIGGLLRGLRTGLVVALAAGLTAMSLVLIGIIAFNEPITLVVRWPRRHEFLEIFGIALLSSLFTALGSMIDWELTSRNSKVVSAIEFGLLLGLGFGIVLALGVLWFSPIADSPAATAGNTYRADRLTSIIYTVTAAVIIGIGGWLGEVVSKGQLTRNAAVVGVAVGFVTIPLVTLTVGRIATVKIAELILICQGKGKVHFAQLLEEAYRRQILRQAGTMYQFRHGGLQDQLVAMYLKKRSLQ